MIIIYCCEKFGVRYEVELKSRNEIVLHLRCPNCGLAKVEPEENLCPGYAIRDGELVKK